MKEAFLALLAKEPAHGYEIKRALETEFGSLWPKINAGQIYTTLARLERDGLVAAQKVSQTDRPDKVVYEITPRGRATLQEWVQESSWNPRRRDDFFTRLVLVSRGRIADPVTLIDGRRRLLLQQLSSLGAAGRSANDVERLGIEGAILHLQADLKWLESLERHFLKEG